MYPEPIIKPFGKEAILITFESEISENTLEKVLLAEKIITENNLQEEVEVTTAFNSLLVYYKHLIEDVYSEVFRLRRLLKVPKKKNIFDKNFFRIPVCYSPEFGIDLEEISAVKNLSPEEIVSLHSEQIYTLFFTGFLPGFLYLGKLPELLRIPRKKEPRQKIKKGAVGLAEDQTGIYPQVSPGGWQVIGNSPAPLFDVRQDPPCEIAAGDKLQFYPISIEEHREISELVKREQFRLQKERYDG